MESLIEFGSTKAEKPILFYESDADLVMISQSRERLSKFYRFVIPESETAEIFVDKVRFLVLSRDVGLPVPETVFSSADIELP
ncbi:MAG TPA: hypothetical protein VMM38_09130 [Aridibacter sp.]|nr:hypothetical protein [Aridibacter sp.]